jgi:hypothetical protein
LIHGEIGGSFAIGKTGGTCQVAVIGEIDKPETHVLLVVWTNATVIWAAPLYFGREF